MTDSIDMRDLAQFSVLPGAARLMRAFGTIPPGPLRDSVIQHAEVIAATYAAAPAAQRMPDPLAGFAAAEPPKPQLTSRTGHAPKTESLEMAAVKMRMAGVPTHDIAAKTGLTKQQIYQAIYAARKAGIKVPGRAKSGPIEVGSKRWATSLDEMGFQGAAGVKKAAERRGVSPEDYFARRQKALQLAQQGASYETILAETGETDAKVVSAWLSAARGAGYSVPYVTFLKPDAHWREPAQPVQDAVVAPAGRIFPALEDTPPGARYPIQQAAARRGLTAQAYLDLRESIVRHRMGGMAPVDIATLVGEIPQFVSDVCNLARQHGVRFPRLRLEAVETAPLKATG
jgi:hypothetical protein